MVGNAVLMGSLAIVSSISLGYPLRDPDGFLGPAWVRLPLLVLLAFAIDIVPRTLWRSRFQPAKFKAQATVLVREHWTRDRIVLVVLGLVCFYVTYVSYRNLKNFLPFVRSFDGKPLTYDHELHKLDHALMFGHDPATLSHQILGTGVSAHVLSWVYLIFLPMVPIAVIAWVVWSRNVSFGYWFVTADCLAWSLGTLSYYLVPTLGPNFSFVQLYADLPHTGVSDLQQALFYGRGDLRYDPFFSGVQSVAGFASLHVGITLMMALVAQYTVRHRADQGRALGLHRAGHHLHDVLRLALHRRRPCRGVHRGDLVLPGRTRDRPAVRPPGTQLAPHHHDRRGADRGRLLAPRRRSSRITTL